MIHDSYLLDMIESCRWSSDQEHQLRTKGFVVIPDMVSTADIARLQEAYDATMAAGERDDLKIGSSTTRLNNFANRGPVFDPLYLFPPLLAACCSIIGVPFKLSGLLGRTLRPHTAAQELHADLSQDSDAFPMAGFILMVDEFRPDNGATRFVPGSQQWTNLPVTFVPDLRAGIEAQSLACGPAGAVVIFNASVWHGHTANGSDNARRSIQGYFVPRTARSGSAMPESIRSETLDRISPLAKYLLAV